MFSEVKGKKSQTRQTEKWKVPAESHEAVSRTPMHKWQLNQA